MNIKKENEMKYIIAGFKDNRSQIRWLSNDDELFQWLEKYAAQNTVGSPEAVIDELSELGNSGFHVGDIGYRIVEVGFLKRNLKAKI